MTERGKKKLVVRLLEQIFSGKGAAAGGHQHPLQQQEVSHIAARADRAENEAQGQRFHREGEGTREAHIMLREVEDPADPSSMRQDGNDSTSPDEGSDERSDENQPERTHVKNHNGNFDQRPTRPLDLDPCRAQVPTENIEYMRHLGFSPPDPQSQESPSEGHGWVYLNLLINMAQLHTINVTAEFVRKALSECSSKFELSTDGRKARWKGGSSVTGTSSSVGDSSNRTDTPDGQCPRKRPKLAHCESHRYNGSNKGGRTDRSRLVYTPLFFHKDSSEDADESSEEEYDSMLSPFPAPIAGGSSGMTSSGVRMTLTKKHKQDDGPIIFYNNARFCTDLSGDRHANSNTNAPPYTAATSVPVGKPNNATVEWTSEKRGPLAEAVELPEPMDMSDNPIPASMELSFPQRSPLRAHEKQKPRPVDLEVTGIGGVWPADNFAIAVESRHARLDHADAPSMSQDVSSRHIPAKFAQILQEAGPSCSKRAAVHKQIIQSDHQDLPPSQLPQALSFMHFGEDSTGDDESDADEEMQVSPGSPDAFPPSAAPQPVELHYTSSDEEEDEDEEEDAESDSSLDLLAAARQVDPDAIREREREYDANMAERLAEEIPTGSSAATAGGGSGFASPASDAKGGHAQKSVQITHLKSGSLKRARSCDSLKVQNAEASESSEYEDEDMSVSDIGS